MKSQLFACLSSLTLVAFLIVPVSGQETWIELFNGENLEGWSIHSGTAKYRVEEGSIVGQAVPNSPNTFLCSDREFEDFILEFEVLLEDPELNSGVQFRSQIASQELEFWFRNDKGEYQPTRIPPDRVYGYQVEIATGGAGGVYDEARRAMLPWWPDPDSKEGQVFKNKEWNAYRVECRGDAIKTTVNGVVVNDFRDALSSKGIIGLQVHDVGEDKTPYQVRWKNIRVQILD
jgi:hypothetical protein